VGGWTREKFLARHPRNEDVDLAIRSESGGEQVAAEISFVLSLKMITGANFHHAA
jgi:DNA repair exonuclease SbcCD ATPase subunit